MRFRDIVLEDRKGQSRAVLAKKIRVAESTVAKWEKGTYFPTITLLKRYARAMHWSDEYFVYVKQLVEEEKGSTYEPTGFVDSELLHRLNEKYDEMRDWDLNDPLVILFRRNLGVVK